MKTIFTFQQNYDNKAASPSTTKKDQLVYFWEINEKLEIIILRLIKVSTEENYVSKKYKYFQLDTLINRGWY